MLEHETEMSEVLEMCSLDKRVIVSIGEESKASGLNEISMVTARYKGGTVAIIGPLRMNYREAISAVSTAAHTLDDILE
jgi:transcriptional regulator of heat shock response